MRTIFIILLLAGTSSGQTTGTWKMNPDKSRHDDQEPFPQSFVMRIEPHPEGEAVTVWRVTQNGRSETDSYIQRFDGKDHPYPRAERIDSFNASKLEDGSIEIIFKKNGKMVARQTRLLPADGQQMTIEYQVLSKTGHWLDRIIVLEKQIELQRTESQPDHTYRLIPLLLGLAGFFSAVITGSVPVTRS